MDISSLQAFITVARYKSFSKASEHMFITQPAVSKRVASLEDELGARLFNRITRQISLTDAGKQLLPKAQDLVSQAEDMQRYASNLNDSVSGRLAVAIAHHVGLHRMPPILKEFNRRYPDVWLDILFEDSHRAFHAVEQGDIEFAVVTLPTELPTTLEKQPIWVDTLNVVAGVEHPVSKLTSVTIEELSHYSALLPSKDTETHQIIRREFESEGFELEVQMETNNLETLKMMVAAGLGWSLLPKSMQDASLKMLDIGKTMSRELGLVVHRKRSLSNAAGALRALIESS